jgi:menaquinone-dependent protoporphyrinogen IX oxidase
VGKVPEQDITVFYSAGKRLMERYQFHPGVLIKLVMRPAGDESFLLGCPVSVPLNAAH